MLPKMNLERLYSNAVDHDEGGQEKYTFNTFKHTR